MKTKLMALLVLMPAVAGCIADEEMASPLVGDLETAMPREIGWSLDGCKAVVAVVHVPKEKLQPHVPEGWRIAAPEEQGGPQDPRGDAALGIEVFTCASSTASNVTANETKTDGATYASYWSWVEPPAEYKVEGVMFHFWKWDTLMSNETVRNELLAEGLPIVNGTAKFGGEKAFVTDEKTFLSGPLGPNAFNVQLDWHDGKIDMAGVAGAPFETKEFSFVEYMNTTDGRIVAWTTDVVGTQVNIGVGDVQLGTSTWAYDIIGMQRAPAYFFAAEWSFTNGKLVIPPKALGNETVEA